MPLEEHIPGILARLVTRIGSETSLDQDVFHRLARQMNAELAKLTKDHCLSLVGFRTKLDQEVTDLFICSQATGLPPLFGGWGVRTGFVSGSTRNEWSDQRNDNPASHNVRLTMRNSTAPPSVYFPSFYEMADLKDALATNLHVELFFAFFDTGYPLRVMDKVVGPDDWLQISSGQGGRNLLCGNLTV